MDEPAENRGIIRSAVPAWLLVLVAVVAIILIVILFAGILAPPRGHHPRWAPDGCSVYRQIEWPNRAVIILVLDEENFDTEAECASVILNAIKGEEAFFRGQATHVFDHDVQIQFPMREGHVVPILQYVEVQAGEHHYNLLRTVDVRPAYNNNVITVEELQKIADGQLELGFLKGIFPEEQ